MTIDASHWLDDSLSQDERWKRHDQIMRDLADNAKRLVAERNSPTPQKPMSGTDLIRRGIAAGLLNVDETQKLKDLGEAMARLRKQRGNI